MAAKVAETQMSRVRSVTWCATVVCLLVAAYRTSNMDWTWTAADATTGMATMIFVIGSLGSLVPEMTAEQWLVWFLLAALWATLKRGESVMQVSTSERTAEGPGLANVQPSKASSSSPDVSHVILEPIYCAERGDCFHLYGCHVLRNVHSKIKRYKPCVYCTGVR